MQSFNRKDVLYDTLDVYVFKLESRGFVYSAYYSADNDGLKLYAYKPNSSLILPKSNNFPLISHSQCCNFNS